MPRPPKWEAEIKAFSQIMLDRYAAANKRQKFHAQTAIIATLDGLPDEAAEHTKTALISEGEAIVLRILMDTFNELFTTTAPTPLSDLGETDGFNPRDA